MMNGSKAAYRPPALQLLCLCDGGHQRQTSKMMIWRHASSSSADERFELLSPDLDGRTAACVVRAAVLVRKDGVDGCGVGACRRSDLTRTVTQRQIQVSYACR